MTVQTFLKCLLLCILVPTALLQIMLINFVNRFRTISTFNPGLRSDKLHSETIHWSVHASFLVYKS